MEVEHIEYVIIKNLIDNNEYSIQVAPFVKSEYFELLPARFIVEKYIQYTSLYNSIPSFDNVLYEIKRDTIISSSEKLEQELEEFINICKQYNFEHRELSWLIKTTEERFQEVALEKAILESAKLLSDKKNKDKKIQIPEIIKNAMRVSFDINGGREFGTQDDIDTQWLYYHTQLHKYPFKEWSILTKRAMKGGCSKGKLHIVTAGTGVGKTLCLVNIAKQLLLEGLNVFYATMEISENEIRERIDGNLFNTDIEKMVFVGKDKYLNKIQDIKNNTKGRFFVKQFTNSSANVLNFKYVLNDYKLKYDFTPDVFISDYMGIMSSSKIKMSDNMYLHGKTISEELRDFSIEHNLITWTAWQFNREGNNNSDPSMSSVSESFGINFTSDFTLAIIETPELKEKNQYLFKVLKNRYTNITSDNEKWYTYVDKPKQKITECDIIESNSSENIDSDNSNNKVTIKF
jgi:hypothetical protein